LGGNTDICPAALAAARGQPAPADAKPQPAKPGAPNAGAPNAGAPNAGAILKNLFR
jgi:hypothetical protein